MITVYLNKPEFEYDIHSLIKAFYPGETVSIYYTCSSEEVEGKNLACTHHEAAAGGMKTRDYRQTDLPEKEKKAGNEQPDVLEKEKVSAVCRVDYGTDSIEVFWERLSPAADRPGSDGPACAVSENAWEYHKIIAVSMGDRSLCKNQLKRGLYDLLSQLTGKKLPWGTLTGIRPTKIPMKLLEEGRTEGEISSYMKETYLTSEKKTELSIEIAERELSLLKRIDYERGYSLYIGIPFCPSTCAYCSFTSFPLKQWKDRVDLYLDALEREIDFTAEACKDRVLNSVYIGGGTPTTLEAYQLDRLIRKIRSSFDLSHCLEFTVEAGRPDSIIRDKLMALKENGITRISVNPQTMKQETLDLIGRRHTVEQTLESFELARACGMDNINMDLILGLPDETIEDVRHTMEVMSSLSPENITIHSLAVKRAAKLTIYKDRYEKMQMVNTEAHMELCEDYCRRMGLAPYYLYRQKGMAGNLENVGYAKPGRAGVYNILIMEEKQTIMALGAGATTKFVLPERNPDGSHRIERVENVKSVDHYLSRTDEMIRRKQDKMEELQWH